jgi:hypothetical protein
MSGQDARARGSRRGADRVPFSSTEVEGKRPLLGGARKWVVALSLFLMALALANLARAVMALRYAALLPDLPMTVSWEYLVVMAAGWAAALTVCAVGLLRLRVWGRRATLVVATLYQAHVWVNHLLFDASDYALQTRPRDALLTAAFLGVVWGVLSVRPIREVFAR